MELEVIKKLIKNNTIHHATVVVNTMVAERYYKNDNDILYEPIKKDAAENPLRNADNRICNNFHGLLVNQKASYLFTAPPIFDVDNEGANKRITETLGDNYSKACKDLCINASNAGIGWLHYWINKDNQFEYGVVDSKQIIPIWSTQLNKKLLGVLRVYPQVDDLGDTYDIYEYWNETECQAFRKLASSEIDDGLQAYSMFTSFIVDTQMTETSDILKHESGRVPFIPFFNNNIMVDDLKNIKGHADTYDKVYSDFVNDLEDIQEIIFILTNYEGEDLGEFLTSLKKYKTVKTTNDSDSDKSGLQTLTIDIPIEAREKLLDITRKAIFEKGQGVDPQPDAFGNASGVALKFMYSLLELKAGLLETEFRLGFGDFIRAICQYLKVECKTISQTWTRTAITNDTEIAAICTSSVGVISQQTLLKNHPFVDDVQAELKDLEDEKQKQIDSYGPFPLEPQSDPVNDDEMDN